MDAPMDTPPDGTRAIQSRRPDVSVAIIDDEELQRRALRRLLQGKGFSVQDFESAEAALRSGVLLSCDLILLDVLLCGENGISACRRLRELKFGGGIVMVSCLATRTSRSRRSTREPTISSPSPPRARNFAQGCERWSGGSAQPAPTVPAPGRASKRCWMRSSPVQNAGYSGSSLPRRGSRWSLTP